MKKSAATKPVQHENIVFLREIVATRASDLELSNKELAYLMGYGSENIISMFKNGSMKLPPNKVAITAAALEIDPVYLMRSVDEEGGHNISGIIEEIMGRAALTENEQSLAVSLRKVNRGMDIDMDKYPEIKAEILRKYEEAAMKEKALHNSCLEGLVGKHKRSAVSSGKRRLDEDASSREHGENDEPDTPS